jgi:curved DNA-binding protein CbpA
MAVKTFYSVLGLASTAESGEIEDAFDRIKAQHPKAKLEADENARVRYLAAQQAHEVLSDPEKRALYDLRLAKAGIKVNLSSAAIISEGNHGLLTTRNIIVAGIILILISGMWVYHVREKAKAEKAIAERVMRLAEQEKQRRAESEARAEELRQAAAQSNEERQRKAEERQFQIDAQRASQQVDARLQADRRQAETQQRQEQAKKDQALRQEQLARQQADRDIQRRLQEEKLQLQALCRQRYNRSDC